MNNIQVLINYVFNGKPNITEINLNNILILKNKTVKAANLTGTENFFPVNKNKGSI